MRVSSYKLCVKTVLRSRFFFEGGSGNPGAASGPFTVSRLHPGIKERPQLQTKHKYYS